MKVDKNGYIVCSPKNNYKHKKTGLFSSSLHKILIQPDSLGRSVVVDHIDGNKFNNQKSNLRICTHTENMRNRKVHKKRTENPSRYKGVFWDCKLTKWRAQIQIDGKRRVSIGCFTDEDAAANAYNYYALYYYNEFAMLNDCKYMDKDQWMGYSSKKNLTSLFKGVSFCNGKWIAQICHNYQKIKIGDYESEIDAAIAYNQEAMRLKGKRARLNIVNDLGKYSI